MRYDVFVNRSVEKFLKKHLVIKKTFKKKSQLLSDYQNWHSLDWKKMMGYENDYRLRIGKYRFLATISKEKILIYFYKADSRGGSYK